MFAYLPGDDDAFSSRYKYVVYYKYLSSSSRNVKRYDAGLVDLFLHDETTTTSHFTWIYITHLYAIEFCWSCRLAESYPKVCLCKPETLCDCIFFLKRKWIDNKHICTYLLYSVAMSPSTFQRMGGQGAYLSWFYRF